SCTFFQHLQFFSYLYYIAYRTNVHALKQKKGAIQLGIEMPSFLALNVIKNSNSANPDPERVFGFTELESNSNILGNQAPQSLL
ncbi:hypothetical protein, partial [uncultured Lactobacillus sp.]|uniref:hypothetical protein n=1 Tax=uncultured Lactobacillus sp. TaxID=153152 RepID=UPI002665C7A7